MTSVTGTNHTPTIHTMEANGFGSLRLHYLACSCGVCGPSRVRHGDAVRDRDAHVRAVLRQALAR